MTNDLERRIRAEQKKMDAIFFGAESPLVIFRGPDFILEQFNEKYQAIYTGRALKEKKLLEAVPELKNSIYPEILKKVYETGEPYISVEGPARIKNSITGVIEERYFDTSFSRIDYGTGDCFRILATPREVTERVNSRKVLEQSLLELQQERELREKFISSLTHDLRTPLAIVKVSTQILKRKADDPATVKDSAEKIVFSIDRADRMIRDLLDANRIKAGRGIPLNMQECVLSTMIEYFISDLKNLYGNRFLFLNDAGDIRGFWDHNALHRLIDNLVSNAVKYGEESKLISISLFKIEDYIEISIHNEGSPIPLEDQETLFDLYSRNAAAIKSGQKGWGIGLSLVKGIAEAHGGSVKLKSDNYNGTTFTVRLPVDCRTQHVH